jgi:membrane-bound ClpP family serine protease
MYSTIKSNTMKNILTNNWNPARIFRVALGIAAVIYAIVSKDSMMGWIGALLLLMGLSNTGCCGASGCAAPMAKNKAAKSSDEIDFEEIK